MPSADVSTVDSAELTLRRLAEQLLLFCNSQTQSRDRLMAESAAYREAGKQLKTIFDSEAANERLSIERMARFPRLLNHLDANYYSLKDEAKVMIRAVQDERQKVEAERDELLKQGKELESAAYNAKMICQQQKTEIQELTEASKAARGGDNVDVVRAALRELEGKNAALRDEIGRLEHMIQESQAADDFDGEGYPDIRSQRQGEERLRGLQDQLAEIKAQLEGKRRDNAIELQRLQQRNEDLSETGKALLKKAEKLNSA